MRGYHCRSGLTAAEDRPAKTGSASIKTFNRPKNPMILAQGSNISIYLITGNCSYTPGLFCKYTMYTQNTLGHTELQ